ncbi:hypothetical protein [Membranihabitans marinus]|uniref:hypothetical protein n=1 Tax=Membranihabitans marinus TaxID=1227546 RepID=UPI001F28CB14|nr:hypothetical protein [Membranihabitans marinus]
MRILGQIHHPQIKITLFTHNDKLSVKFEKGQAEIILKFKEDQSVVMENLTQEMEKTQFASIVKQLDHLLIYRNQLEPLPPQDPEFLDII